MRLQRGSDDVRDHVRELEVRVDAQWQGLHDVIEAQLAVHDAMELSTACGFTRRVIGAAR